MVFAQTGQEPTMTQGQVSIMTRAAALITAVAIVSIAIRLASGEGLPIWLVVCIAAIWFGVAMVAIGHHLGRR
jgi:hypothetical protein